MLSSEANSQMAATPRQASCTTTDNSQTPGPPVHTPATRGIHFSPQECSTLPGASDPATGPCGRLRDSWAFAQALRSAASMGDRQPEPGQDDRDRRVPARGQNRRCGFSATHISVRKTATAAVQSAKDGTRATLLGHQRRTVSEPPARSPTCQSALQLPTGATRVGMCR